MSQARQPVFYISHGGGPCFWIEMPPPFGPEGYSSLKKYLAGLLTSLPARPKAFLVFSAHWEEDAFTASAASQPGMIYDYYGFPEHTYSLKYPAPGAPELARRVADLASGAGIKMDVHPDRGFDHGVFVPFLIVDPAGSIPVVTASLRRDLDPAAHVALGAALAPLRDEGVVIVGSGNSYHNLGKFYDGNEDESVEFDAALTAAVTAKDRHDKIHRWRQFPSARACHPREEHLAPLFVSIGASREDDTAVRDFHDVIGGKAHSGFRFG